jgi:hypothetical protein
MLWLPITCACLLRKGDSTFAEYRPETANGVRTTAKAEKKKAVAWPIKLDDRRITIDDVTGQPQPERLADEIVNSASEGTEKPRTGR